MVRKLKRPACPQVTMLQDGYKYETNDATIVMAKRGGRVTRWMFDVPGEKYERVAIFSDFGAKNPALQKVQALTKVMIDESQKAVNLPHSLIFHPEEGREVDNSLLLKAKLGELSFSREFELRKGLVNIYSESPVKALMSERVFLSVGSIVTRGPILLNNEAIFRAFGDETAESDIFNGEPRLWEGFEGGAKIDLPNGSDIYVESSLNGRPVQDALLWAPTSRVLCIEPIVGLNNNIADQAPEMGRAVLATTVEIVLK